MNDSKDGLKRLVQSQQFCNLSDALSEKDSSNENNNSQEQVQKQVSQNESRNAQVKVKIEALTRNASTAHNKKHARVKLEPRTQSDTSDPLGCTASLMLESQPSTSTASLMLESQPSTSTADTEVFSPSTDANVDEDVDENFDEALADEPFADEDDQVNEDRYLHLYSSDSSESDSESEVQEVVVKRGNVKRAASGKFEKKSPIKRPKTMQLTLAAYDFTKSVIKTNGKVLMEKIPRRASCGWHKCPVKGCLMACENRTALRQHIRFKHQALYEVIKKTATPDNFWKTTRN